MRGKYFAGGFLFHPASGKVLLQWRGSKTAVSPETWCFLGGGSEAEDRGRPAATWRREELGVVMDPRAVVPLCDYLPPSNPYHRHVFSCMWPSLAEDFSSPGDEEGLDGGARRGRTRSRAWRPSTCPGSGSPARTTRRSSWTSS